MREGTLTQLNVKVGDKVRPIKNLRGEVIRSGRVQVISKADPDYGWYEGYTMDKAHRDYHRLGEEIIFRLEEEAMKLWKDMTACEKGALLLAYHEGKTIEYHYLTDKNWNEAKKGVRSNLGWIDDYYYRVKPEPVVTEVVRYGQVYDGVEPWGGGFAYSMVQGRKDTHKITFNLVEGEPDCNSIKMIKL